MKQLRYSLVILLCCCSISCTKSFLEVEDNSIIIREQYVKDVKTLQEYLNGIYINLGKDIFEGSYGTRIANELVADNLKPSAQNTFFHLAHYFWNQSNGTNQYGLPNGSDDLWKNGYKTIRACSYLIERAGEFRSENAAKVDQMLGQAYSIRALIHFLLVNTFAQTYASTTGGVHTGVPLITSWDWNDGARRNTVNEVYVGIIDDLQKAIPLLVPNTNNKIVMNQLAAKGLLARVYLFKEDWQQAKTLATEVATAVPLLAAAAYPAKLFTTDETEALFQLAPSSENKIRGGYSTSFEGAYFRDDGTYFIATKQVADLLKQNAGDSRKVWITTSADGIDSIMKFPIAVVPGFGTESWDINRSYYLTVIRSSEMFLTIAEASAKLNDETTARTYLDAIRQRAEPSAAPTTATGTALLDAIYLERRKELAFEGLRMWDLQRWKKGVTRTDATVGAPLTLPYPSDRAIAPIPLNDVNNGMAQNPSY